MPYRLEKPYIIVKGQKLVSPSAVPQLLPVCDRCGELASSHASVYKEIALDRWWKWLSFPQFSCEPEALMGCEKHPIQTEIQFLDRHVEPFIRLPATRWQRLTAWDVIVAAFIFAVIVAVVFHFLGL